jgi:uncharacterized phage protein (TIGR02220 family)
MSSTKDPAVLFYTSDFLTGVSGLTMEERGQYITLLCLQHQQGALTEKMIRLAVGNLSEDVRAKFSVDEHGRLYQERMAIESERRRAYNEGRRANGSKGGRPPTKPTENHMDNHMDMHMGNHSENENININTIKYIVSILNDKLGTKYKYSSEYIARLIKARLGEGFTPEDFEIVISKKLQEWKGTRFEKFLRPETLFGTKFQSYLNEIHTEQEPAVPKYSNASAEAALQEAMLRSYGG